MSLLYRDHAVVLRTIKLGEADRIVTVMTEGHGKVRAVAKGVRKTKSRFGSRLEPCSHVAVQLYEGRQLDTITQAETVDHFRPIREDLDRLARATALLEAVDQIAQEGEANPRLYQMLVGGLRSLSGANAPLLVAAFFFKLLSLEGAHPLVNECASCGATEPLVGFALSEGGVLCRSCTDGRGRYLSPEALELIRTILSGGVSRALTVDSSAVTTEVDHIATWSLEQHVERRLKSTAVLDRA